MSNEKKGVRINVMVEFSDPIYSDNELDEVAANVARAIVNEANGEGIAPENSEGWTVAVYASAKYSSTGNEYILKP